MNMKKRSRVELPHNKIRTIFALLGIAASTIILGSVGMLVAQNRLGDVTGDGRVDIKDALKVLRIVDGAVTATDADRELGDVFPNPGQGERPVGDGQLTEGDANQLLRFSVGLLTPDALEGKEVFSVAPARANVVVGTQQQFTAFIPDGSAVTWSVEGMPGADVGSINKDGLYTAPRQIPDPPVFIVRARSQRNPGITATATVILLSASDIRITREQAIKVVKEKVIDKLPNKEGVVAFGTQQPLASGDEIKPFSSSNGQTTAERGIQSPCWFFMVDEAPIFLFAHPVRYVFVDCATGEMTEKPETFFPVINGQIFWDSVTERAMSPDRVFVGSAAEGALGALEKRSNVRPFSAHRPLLQSVFTPNPAACDCPDGPQKVALLVAGADGWRDDFLSNVDRMAVVLRQEGFIDTRILSDSSPELVRQEIQTRLRRLIRPCDLFLFYYSGHGLKEGTMKVGTAAEEGNLDYNDLAEDLQAIVARRKIIILDTCYAGSAISAFEASDSFVVGTELLMASQADTASIGLPFGGGGIYSNAFIKCLSSAPRDIFSVHTCAAEEVAWNIANIIKGELGGEQEPQIRFTGSPDSDRDGVADQMETRLGTDPSNPDSDGDGDCDGLELRRLEDIKRPPPRIITTNAQFGPDGGILTDDDILQLPPGRLNVPYPPQTVRAVLGTEPLVFLPIREGLPRGLEISPGGVISGTPEEGGDFRFTLEVMDDIGARGTLASMEATLTVEADAPVIEGSTIHVTSGADNRIPDDDLTLREAILLANHGTGPSGLGRPLTTDPDPNDEMPKGEERLVGGANPPGRDRKDRIITLDVGGGFVLTEGPLVLDADAGGDSISIGAITAQRGPILEIAGKGNSLSATIVGPPDSTAILITGNSNVVSASVQSAGGPAIHIRGGSDNSIQGTIFQNNAEGIRLSDGASNNSIGFIDPVADKFDVVTIVGNRGDGVIITSGANSNTIRNCAIGVRIIERGEQIEVLGNTGSGVVISGGCKFNRILRNAIGGNGGSGIQVTGQNTAFNTLEGNKVGGFINPRTRRIVPIANARHGVVISDGASNNSISADSSITDNTGHGLLITGQGTRANTVETTSIGGNTGDGIRIEAGARGNTVGRGVSVTNQDSGNGIAIVGEGTSGNHIAGERASSAAAVSIGDAGAAGVLLAQGASSNNISGLVISGCADGIVMEGTATTDNEVSDAIIKGNTGHGIKLSAGCRKNRINGRGSSDPIDPNFITVFIGNNDVSGIAITGAGTRENEVRGCTLGDPRRDGNHAVEITDGAQRNLITGCGIVGHRLGGILLSGDETESNRVEDNIIFGGLSEDEILISGAGVIIEEGAQNNLISGNEIGPNGSDGVRIIGANTVNNVVTANLIGVGGLKGLVTVLPPPFEFSSARGQRTRIVGTLTRRAGFKQQEMEIFEAPNRGGIVIENAPQNTIGSLVGGGNIISGNRFDGILITGPNAAGNRVMGNLIGTDLSGTKAMPNGLNGVTILDDAHDNTIGGVRPVRRNPQVPLLTLPPQLSDLGAGNLISANKGSGIRISSPRVKGNKVLGNLIGFSFGESSLGNGGNGITISDGAQNSCIGNCVSLAESDPGFGNIITSNSSAGILISGVTTTGHTINRNIISRNGGFDIFLVDGGNGGVQPPTIMSFDPVTQRIRGVAPSTGIVEAFTDILGGEGAFHFAAFVKSGAFTIDQLDPSQSQNALIFDNDRPLRFGTLRLTFTDRASGNTSSFAVPTVGSSGIFDFGTEGTQQEVRVVPPKEVLAGSSVDVGINAGNFSNVGALLFDLSYDPDRLTLEGVTLRADKGDRSLLASNPETLPSASGQVRIGTLFARGRSGDSMLLTLRFHVELDAQGEIPLQIENLTAVDVNLQEVAVNGVGAVLPEVIPAEKADLAVVGLRILPRQAVVNQPVKAVAVIENVGMVAVPEGKAKVSWVVEDAKFNVVGGQTEPLPQIQPGKKLNMRFRHTFSLPGVFFITAVVELDEDGNLSNNEKGQKMKVRKGKGKK